MKYYVIGLLLLSLQTSALEITVNPGKYTNYFHFQYVLEKGKYVLNKKYGFNSGGQFEVFVPKSFFPVAAPNCRRHIIIRMPYSANEEKKAALYQRLLNNEDVRVTLELNPYVTVLNSHPLEVELQYCNVFFRHRGGDYYDRL